MHRDYLRSIVMLTDENGNIAERRHFDPWGHPIKVEDGAGKVLQGLTLLDRGFTAHEHLQTVGLINMNARLYDPVLHRFLQPDNYVQDLIQPYILRLIFSLFFYVCCFKLLNVIKALLERLSIIGDFVLSLIISSYFEIKASDICVVISPILKV